MTTTAKTAKQLADERQPDTFDYNGTTFTVPDRALLGDGELTGLLLGSQEAEESGDSRELTACIYAILRLMYPHGAWRGVLAKLRGADGRVDINAIPVFVNAAIGAMNPNS